MGKKEFTAIVLDLENKTFIIYVLFFNSTSFTNDIYPSRKLQIIGLINKKVFIKIFVEYICFIDMFFLDLAFELSKNIGINNHAIELVI